MKQNVIITLPHGTIATYTGDVRLPAGEFILLDVVAGARIPVTVTEPYDENNFQLPEHLKTEAFAAAWQNWLGNKKKKPSPKAITMQTNRLAAMTHDDAVESIAQSIEKGWATFYPPENRNGAGKHLGSSRIAVPEGYESEHPDRAPRVASADCGEGRPLPPER